MYVPIVHSDLLRPVAGDQQAWGVCFPADSDVDNFLIGTHLLSFNTSKHTHTKTPTTSSSVRRLPLLVWSAFVELQHMRAVAALVGRLPRCGLQWPHQCNRQCGSTGFYVLLVLVVAALGVCTAAPCASAFSFTLVIGGSQWVNGHLTNDSASSAATLRFCS